MHATPKEFPVGLQENLASRSGDGVCKLRDFRMFERLKPANPNERRNGLDLWQGIGNSGINLRPQNQWLAAATARDTGGDSKLEV